MDALGVISKNIEFVSKEYPALEGILKDTNPLKNIIFFESKSGNLIAKFKDISLNSGFDPKKEAERFVEANSIEYGDNVFLYGFGIGYHVEEIITKIGINGNLFVMELNPEILLSAMNVVDMEKLSLKCNFRIIFAKNENEVFNQINSLAYLDNGKPLKFLIHQPSLKCIPAGFKNIVSFLDGKLINNRTKTVFKKYYYENIEKNIDVILSYPGVSAFKNKFNGVPAVIVGAGPSLDCHLEFIARYYKKAYIFAVDTAYPVLIEAGITPDFVISVDPQPKTLNHFRLKPEKDVPLIISPVSCAEAVMVHNGPYMIFLQKGHSVTVVTEDLLSDKGFSSEGGSVSCIALDIMIEFGFNPIIMAGMDYAYPNMKAYCANSAETGVFYKRNKKFLTIDLLHYKRIYSEKTLYTSSYFNNRVLSSPNLMSYKKSIESLIEANLHKRRFYNLAFNGAFIKGAGVIYDADINAELNSKLDKIVKIEKIVYDPSLKEKILNQLYSGLSK